MGRTRTKKITTIKPQPSVPVKGQEPSINSLLDKAHSLIAQCNYDLAQRFLRRILCKDPGNSNAKEMLGVALLETGEIDAAREVFSSLLPPCPDAPDIPPPSAHLYLAQLSEDDPRLALQHYRAAIDILLTHLKGKDRAIDVNKTGDEADIKTSIVQALVSQVEIWMDPSYDLCFEPEAESTCENLISLALDTDPGNVEALQALASVRLSQQRPADAKECLGKAWNNWKDLDPDNEKLPCIPTRLTTARLFLELHLFEPALQVLQSIMASDDRNVEAWYLEGWCFFLMSEEARKAEGNIDALTWQEFGRDARDCLETCKNFHVNEGHPDLPLLKHAEELITQLDGLGVSASILEEDEDEESQWESPQSSDLDIDMG